MKQWGFYFDETRCVGCKACIIACKENNEELRGDIHIHQYDINTDYTKNNKVNIPSIEECSKYYMKENWRRVSQTIEGTFPSLKMTNLSLSCNHCTNPACIPACPVEAISKDSEYGIVQSDRSICISCGSCEAECPWGAPQYYDKNYADYAEEDPARPRMTKCNLCIGRIKEGLKPACVAVCPARALDAGPIKELKIKYKDAVTSTANFNNIEKIKLHKPNLLLTAKYAAK